jgi:hypothetical protein
MFNKQLIIRSEYKFPPTKKAIFYSINQANTINDLIYQAKQALLIF